MVGDGAAECKSFPSEPRRHEGHEVPSRGQSKQFRFVLFVSSWCIGPAFCIILAMAAGSKTVIYAALVGNGLIAVTKFIAAGISGSSAMVSEGIHSLVDTGNQVLLLWGLKKAKQPADERFPFGHGKEVYFWSFVVAIMIFAVGAGVALYEGIKHTIGALDPEYAHEYGDPTMSYIVLVLAMIFEGFAWYFAWREFKKHKGDMPSLQAVREGKDPTMFVVLFEDSAAMAGLVVALIGVYLTNALHMPVIDGVTSIIIGLILGGVAVWLAIETKSLLIGESAASGVTDGLRKILGEHPDVTAVNEVLTMHMGPETIVATASIDFADGVNSQTVEKAVGDLNDAVKAAYPQVRRIFIEAEAAARHAKQITEANGG